MSTLKNRNKKIKIKIVSIIMLFYNTVYNYFKSAKSSLEDIHEDQSLMLVL